MRSSPGWKRRLLVLVPLLALAAGLRSLGAGSTSLWLDEAFSLDRAAPGEGLVAPIARSEAHDAHPPLYYLALHLWARLVGTSPAAVRGLSAIFSLAAVLVAYRLARLRFEPPIALAVALLLATSAWQVEYALEARHYALVQLLVLGSFHGFVRALDPGEDRPARWIALHGTLLALALYTFYYSLFAGAALGVAALALAAAGERRRRALALAGVELAALALFLPWIETIRRRVREFEALGPETGWTFPYPGTVLPEVFGSFVLGPGAGAAASVAVLAAVAGGAVLLVRRSPRCFAWPVAALLVGPLVLVAILPYRAQAFEPKHVVFLAPLAALAIGAVLDAVRRLGRPGRLAALAVLAGLVGANLIGIARLAGTEKQDWNEAARTLGEDASPAEAVLVDPPYLRVPLDYALARRGGPAVPILDADPRRPTGIPLEPFGRVRLIEVEGSDLAPSTGRGRQALARAGFVPDGRPLRLPGRRGTICIERFSPR